MNEVDQDISLEELLPWLEFACWTALVLAPILYLVHGPSVSTEQLVVRTLLVFVAAVGALLLRLVNWKRKRALRATSDPPPDDK